MKEDIKKTGETLLLFYLLFMILSSIMAMLCFSFMKESAQAVGMTVGIIVSLLIVFKWWRPDLNREVLLQKSSKKMNVKIFILSFLFLFGTQFCFSILSLGLEEVLKILGLSIEAQLESAQGANQPPIQFVYTLFLGPIAEELIFRGVVFQTLRKYGKSFAILASALLFGIYHGNLPQGMFAFVVGILFAYITAEYSIYWSILIHIFNNINTIWINYGIPKLNFHLLTSLFDIVYAISFIVSVIYLCKNRKKLSSYLRQYPTKEGAWRCLFQSGSIIVFIILNLMSAISGML